VQLLGNNAVKALQLIQVGPALPRFRHILPVIFADRADSTGSRNRMILGTAGGTNDLLIHTDN
jgi:hypothetical protein